MIKADLIDAIEGKKSEDEWYPRDPIDEERESMLEMQETWPQIRTQLTCAKENFACWNCPPAQARSCAVEECDPSILDKIKNAR